MSLITGVDLGADGSGAHAACDATGLGIIATEMLAMWQRWLHYSTYPR